MITNGSQAFFEMEEEEREGGSRGSGLFALGFYRAPLTASPGQ